MILDVRMTEDDMYDAEPGTTQKLPSASMLVLTLLADVIRVPMEATELPISSVAKFIAFSSLSSFMISSTGLVSGVPSEALSFCDAPVADVLISLLWFPAGRGGEEASLDDVPVPTRNIESVMSASFLLPLSMAPRILARNRSCCST